MICRAQAHNQPYPTICHPGTTRQDSMFIRAYPLTNAKCLLLMPHPCDNNQSMNVEGP
jgi:hypothetical protein